ncbi:MAG: Gfo/Idh/MocA family oxidoreductase [Bacteroidota bacterium]
MDTFKWGIIGLGKIAHKFARDLQLVEGAVLHAVASRSEERSQVFASQYEVPQSFGTYQGILSSEINAVYIATPHVSHMELTMMALEAKIPVLCEKAFGINEREVQRMVDLARRQRVFLMEALWTRFLPNMLGVRAQIEQGTIGRLQSISADFGFKAPFDPEKRLFNPALGGGALLDIGIYPIFLAYSLFGEPDEVGAIAHLGATGVDEEIGMLFQYTSGAMAQLQASFRYTSPCEAHLYGTEGTIRIPGRWHEGKRYELSYYDSSREAQSYEEEYDAIGYAFEIQHLMQQIRAGKTESPWWSLEDSLGLMRTMDRIRKIIGLVYPQDVR